MRLSRRVKGYPLPMVVEGVQMFAVVQDILPIIFYLEKAS
jgi:hypothetical protein